ncbi:hypothetical protein F5X68DRAFT_227259 [Plectosphaerella plurivora]|uniref:DUF7702 domain-containing protein n=1 Tax=Plectosphaerella plurivora TaxID=936078 RepID=A0A9P8VLB3_9PEZI|nr:hypothetical protein F5X68DRAFT_227259 [Plectosphaerella plurivora]
MNRSFNARDGVAIAQIILFTATFGLGVTIRIQRKNGWFSMVAVSIFRLVGASCLLATLRNGARSVWAGAFVCESFGLILLTYMLLNQNDSLHILTKWHFRVPDLICWAGIGVSVADFALAARQDDPMAPNAMTQAGFGLFISIYVWAVFLYIQLWLARGGLPASERRALTCFAATMAPMVVRIAYSLVYTVTGDKKFSAVVGSAIIYVFMTLIPEVAVIGFVAWATLSMSRPTRDEDIAGQKGEAHEFGPVNSRDSRDQGAV